MVNRLPKGSSWDSPDTDWQALFEGDFFQLLSLLLSLPSSEVPTFLPLSSELGMISSVGAMLEYDRGVGEGACLWLL